jgi:hypothetical protein
MRAKCINEIYSSQDMKHGDDMKDIGFGIALDFKDDFRLKRMIIKKLVRLKYQVPNEFKKSVDDILNLIDGDNTSDL